MGWTTQELSEHLKMMLGAPHRQVELTKENLDSAIKRSIRQLTSVKPIVKNGNFTINNGVQAYDFTALNKPFGKGILNVYDQPITQPSAVFTEFEYYRIRQPPYVDMGELILDQMYYKEIGYLTGTHFEWEWDPDRTMLLVSPIPTRTRVAGYAYNADADTIEQVRPADQGWVVAYALAIAKEMLGRVRLKFKGVPGSELPVDTDGSELVSEGVDAQKELVETLWKKRGDWTPPMKG